MLITKNVRFKRVVLATWKISLVILFVCLLSYLFNEYLLSKYFEFPGIVDTILGTALAFFIGFSNNQAYDRWWEARKIWGSFVNDSRSWARQVLIYPVTEIDSEKDELATYQKKMVNRHIAFLYALKNNLRGETEKEYKKYLSKEEFEEAITKSNIHNQILTYQTRDLKYLYSRKWIDGYSFMSMNAMLNNFSNYMGMSERIKNTVFPPTYNHYTRLFIWILIVSSTFVMGNLVGLWSVLFGFLLGYVFLITHLIGQRLLNPFEPLPLGISLNQITRTIEINLTEAMGVEPLPDPVLPVDGEYVM
jgi:putative membrane protein